MLKEILNGMYDVVMVELNTLTEERKVVSSRKLKRVTTKLNLINQLRKDIDFNEIDSVNVIRVKRFIDIEYEYFESIDNVDELEYNEIRLGFLNELYASLYRSIIIERKNQNADEEF